MNLDEIKEEIETLWDEEARQIIEGRKSRQKQANALRASWSVVNEAHEAAEALRAEAEGLLLDHSRALLADDDEEAERIKARHRDLEERAGELDQQAGDALQTLRDHGVEGKGRETITRELEAKTTALEAQSREEIQVLEQIQHEANDLYDALINRAKPFVQAIPKGAELTQAVGYQITRTG